AFHSASSTLWVTWTRPANSHTGQRRLNAASQAGQMAASDYARATIRKFSLATKGGVHRWKLVDVREDEIGDPDPTPSAPPIGVSIQSHSGCFLKSSVNPSLPGNV